MNGARRRPAIFTDYPRIAVHAHMCAYLAEVARLEGQPVVESWLDEYQRNHPEDTALIVETSWRVSSGDRAANRLVQVLRRAAPNPREVAALGYGRWTEDVSLPVFLELVRGLHAHAALRDTALTLIDLRLERKADDLAELDGLALELVCDGSLVRAGQMAGFHWARVANRFAPTRARAVAVAIFREQATRTDEPWFLESSEAHEVLVECVKHDPSGVWQELRVQLETSEASSSAFVIGFPKGIVDELPMADVLGWIEGSPAERAKLIARI